MSDNQQGQSSHDSGNQSSTSGKHPKSAPSHPPATPRPDRTDALNKNADGGDAIRAKD